MLLVVIRSRPATCAILRGVKTPGPVMTLKNPLQS
jgi:hypothetical protein